MRTTDSTRARPITGGVGVGVGDQVAAPRQRNRARPMSAWTPEQAAALTAPQEINVATRRADGSLRGRRTIWIVGHDDRVFIRSTNGPDGAWFRGALSTLAGQIHAGRNTYDVTFTEAAGA